MVRAIVLHLVRDIFLKRAVLTLLVRQVLVFAFAQLLPQIVVETLMLHKLVIVFCLLLPLVFSSIDHLDRFLGILWCGSWL